MICLNLYMQRRFLLCPCWLFISLFLQAQSPSYPKNYFRNPLGIPMQLSANFGELRPDHWHMGLDIRTNQKENLPVYAAAEGYIAHIGIRPGSFGRFIIINHPNGLSTLYAHLNDFFPELEKFVTEEQYKKESWAIELDFKSDQFPVGKGKFIAYSGNTGGSQGPHLHFEIFDTWTTKRLNPLLFGMTLQDNTAPAITKLALYDRSLSMYNQTPLLFNLKNTDSGYIIPKMPVIKTGWGKLSFGIQTFDKTNPASSPNGVYSAELLMDGDALIQFVLDSIDYNATAYINAHIDYKYDYYGGAYIQQLSEFPGDNGGVYKKIKSNGIIQLSDTNVHPVSIVVKDAHNNTSQLNFMIQYSDSLAKEQSYGHASALLLPGEENTVTKPDFKALLPANSLYDTVPAIYYRSDNKSAFSVSAAHTVNDAYIPLHGSFEVRLKPNKGIPDPWKEKIIIQRTAKNSNIKKAKWDNGWVTASFNDFGTFQAFADTTAPSVNELGKGDTVNLSAATRILFTPRDNFGIIRLFRAQLNGQWIRFTNDKGRNWIYSFDERCPYGVHHLEITVEDLVGNRITREWWFKRAPYTPPPPKKKAVKKGSSKKAPVKKKTTTTTKKKG